MRLEFRRLDTSVMLSWIGGSRIVVGDQKLSRFTACLLMDCEIRPERLPAVDRPS